MSRLVSPHLPVSFVVGRVLPTAEEIAYGYHEGFIDGQDVVAIEVAKRDAEVSMSLTEKQLARLGPDDYAQVPMLVNELAVSSEPLEARARVWLFLCMAWVLDTSTSFKAASMSLDMLYADFEYPSEIDDLVSWMPAAPGQELGYDAIERRWRAYLARVGNEYSTRDNRP